MITMYTKPNCPYCDRAKSLLESRGVEYTMIDVSVDPAARQVLVNQGLRSVPQIYNNDTHIPGGYQGLVDMSPEEFDQKVRN